MEEQNAMVDREGEALRAELTVADFANNINPVLKAIEEAGEMEPLADSLRKLAAADRIERVGPGVQAYFSDLRFRYANAETTLNLLGYDLMGQGS